MIYETMKTKTGKPIRLPVKMYRESDLCDMGVEYVENNIYFNKIKPTEKIPALKQNVKNNMPIADYIDYSNVAFSNQNLKECIERQMSSDNDFIILPHFRGETEYDTRKKIEVAKRLKITTIKDIILEISYKSTIPISEIIKESDNIDYLAIFYGVHYGRYPSFKIICEKIYTYKNQTGKNVFCTAVPLIFAADNTSQLMPIWALISEGWVKNWLPGGSQDQEIKLVDFKDLKNKDKLGWLGSGHINNEIIPQVNVTLHSLFDNSAQNKSLRDTYKQVLLDEIFSEISMLHPQNIESYINEKVPPIYYSLIISLYREKMLIKLVRKADWLKSYSDIEKQDMESELRQKFSPAVVQMTIDHMKELVKQNKLIPAKVLIEEIKNYRPKI